MRILILTSDYLPNIGGIATHVVGLSRALARLGHEVTVAVPMRCRVLWPSVREESDQGVRVVRLASPAAPVVGAALSDWHVSRWIKGQNFDVIHWHTFNEGVIRRLGGAAKVPAVFTNHTSFFLEAIADPARMPRAREIVEPADFVIAPSQELVDASVAAGFPADRAALVANGVDTDVFTPSVDGRSIREKFEIGPDECVILCPRRLAKKNGVIYWIRAIPQIVRDTDKPVRFLIVGDYQYADSASSRDEVLGAIGELKLGNRIIFTGAIPNDQMPHYYAAADIVVLPSLMEATSIAGLEAMATGRVLIGTRVGGIPEIINENETGLLVPPRDPEALAQAAVTLIESPDLRQRMGAAARQRAEQQFDWLAVARRTAEIYDRVGDKVGEQR